MAHHQQPSNSPLYPYRTVRIRIQPGTTLTQIPIVYLKYIQWLFTSDMYDFQSPNKNVGTYQTCLLAEVQG